MAAIRPLNEELQTVAREQLNEIENRIPKELAALRAWLEKQPHLKSPSDDQFLVAFVRGGKYRLEKAKSKLDYFYSFKTMMPELFANKKMHEKYIELCRSGCVFRIESDPYYCSI